MAGAVNGASRLEARPFSPTASSRATLRSGRVRSSSWPGRTPSPFLPSVSGGVPLAGLHGLPLPVHRKPPVNADFPAARSLGVGRTGATIFKLKSAELPAQCVAWPTATDLPRRAVFARCIISAGAEPEIPKSSGQRGDRSIRCWKDYARNSHAIGARERSLVTSGLGACSGRRGVR